MIEPLVFQVESCFAILDPEQLKSADYRKAYLDAIMIDVNRQLIRIAEGAKAPLGQESVDE